MRILNTQKSSRSGLVRRAGAVTVEFAVVAPLIFLLFLGGLELTAMNFVRQTASNASYEAARRAIVPGSTVAEAEAEAMRLLTALRIQNGAVVTINRTTEKVNVTIEIPAANHSWGLTRFSKNLKIRQHCQLTLE
ncbi:MAG: pilus assembly protein [Planctomyces sp.]|nr:pilus assembly protein [Planctomyces sp.]